ncbi:hypothetical protein BDR04DRAFT_1118637 [Suillus decipiens]|nr:hypothetical protein BDR04DRAFT_1118637 [Suillus decipiens]
MHLARAAGYTHNTHWPYPTPIPPVAPITTHSKTTRKDKTGKNSKGTDINTQKPAPIPEELAVDIKMLDNPPAGTSTSLPSTAPDAAPLASTNDFPPDHWIKPMDDSTHPLTNVEMEAICRLTIQTNWVPREDWWITWPFRDNPRSTAATASTPPAFNPPPIIISSSPIFPKFSSISALGHSITNNIFTPDVFSTHPHPGSDGSPVTRCKAPTSASASTINPVPTMGQSGSLTDLAGALSVPLPTVVMESMPSTSAICTLLTGPSNVPADGQSISAPLPNWSFGPQSHQGWSVSTRHAKNSSSDGHK